MGERRVSEERVHVLQERPLGILSDQELIETAMSLGAMPLRRRSLFGGALDDVATIAGSMQDQIVPKGVSNPYWEVVRHIPARPWSMGAMLEPDGTWCIPLSSSVLTRAYEAGVDRFPLCARFSWAIPSPGDMLWLEKSLLGQPVVEIGAGSGYWAWQMTQAGMQVDAFDPHPPGDGNWYNTHKLYHPVLQGDHTIAAGYPDRALMISWPGYETTWATEALAVFKGDALIYIGEGSGGCCADDDFFADLHANWEMEDESGAHVTWWGVHCNLQIWRRIRRAAT